MGVFSCHNSEEQQKKTYISFESAQKEGKVAQRWRSGAEWQNASIMDLWRDSGVFSNANDTTADGSRAAMISYI